LLASIRKDIMGEAEIRYTKDGQNYIYNNINESCLLNCGNKVIKMLLGYAFNGKFSMCFLTIGKEGENV
jgi:hypothetical protein